MDASQLGPEGWLGDIAYGAVLRFALALATLPIGLAIVSS